MPYYPISEEERLKPFEVANSFLQSNPTGLQNYSPEYRALYNKQPESVMPTNQNLSGRSFGLSNMPYTPMENKQSIIAANKNVTSPQNVTRKQTSVVPDRKTPSVTRTANIAASRPANMTGRYNERNVFPGRMNDNPSQAKVDWLNKNALPNTRYDMTYTENNKPLIRETIQGSQRTPLEQAQDTFNYYSRYPGMDPNETMRKGALQNIASIYGSQTAGEANMYGADTSLERQRLANQGDINRQALANKASMYGADKSLEAAKLKSENVGGMDAKQRTEALKASQQAMKAYDDRTANNLGSAEYSDQERENVGNLAYARHMALQNDFQEIFDSKQNKKVYYNPLTKEVRDMYFNRLGYGK